MVKEGTKIKASHGEVNASARNAVATRLRKARAPLAPPALPGQAATIRAGSLKRPAYKL